LLVKQIEGILNDEERKKKVELKKSELKKEKKYRKSVTIQKIESTEELHQSAEMNEVKLDIKPTVVEPNKTQKENTPFIPPEKPSALKLSSSMDGKFNSFI
jgi:hypothetical protein